MAVFGIVDATGHGHEIQIHYSGDWAALYIDGALDPTTVGDAYIAEEKALRMCGVEIVQSDDWMRGQDQRVGVAKTLDEIEEYRIDREAREARAAELREQAAALLAEAKDLDGVST